MSYHITCCLTDASELKTICGSKNQEILSFLIDDLEYDLQEYDEEYGDYFKNENENAQEILSDIVNGEIRFPHLSFIYGYIYETLCYCYGKDIAAPNDAYDSYCFCAVTKGVSKTFGFDYNPKDVPEIYCIENSNLERERAKFMALKEVQGITDEEYLEIVKQDFNFAFEEAIKAGKDLAFFLK